MRKVEDIQWCIYDIDYWNYNILLNKESLNKIKAWETVKTTIYHDSYLFKSKQDIQEWMKKELLLGLLPPDEYFENNELAIVRPHNNRTDKIAIDISKELVDNLIKSGLDSYNYCYNTRWNKMIFYVNDSEKKKELNEKLIKQKSIHSKHKKWK